MFSQSCRDVWCKWLPFQRYSWTKCTQTTCENNYGQTDNFFHGSSKALFSLFLDFSFLFCRKTYVCSLTRKPNVSVVISCRIFQKYHRICISNLTFISDLRYLWLQTKRFSFLSCFPTNTLGVQSSSFEFKPYVRDIYQCTLTRLKAADIDQEVKERAISCM